VNKAAYLCQPDVVAFTTWFGSILTTPLPVHRLLMPARPPITFNGLADALHQYYWAFKFKEPSSGLSHAGSNFAQSAAALTILASGLNAALPPSPSSDSQICGWAVAVMEWGGVSNGNVKWLKARQVGLAAHVSATRRLLSANDDDMVTLNAGISRFNAGMTKVYSLIVDGFIIYDSRVAGALAWFVLKWAQEKKLMAVPESLALRCLPAKEALDTNNPKLRNPSYEKYQFKWINRPAQHAHWNMRASWLLSAAIAAAGKQTHAFGGSNGLRALEAALFMWGYDLAHSPLCAIAPDATSASLHRDRQLA
jgi:hypothetical protein